MVNGVYPLLAMVAEISNGAAITTAWGVTVIWSAFTFAALVSAFREWWADRLELAEAREDGTPDELLIMKGRHEGAHYFLKAFAVRALIGLGAGAQLLFFPSPFTDASIITLALRIGFVYETYALWRAKRSSRVTRRDLEIYYRNPGEGKSWVNYSEIMRKGRHEN